MAVIDKEGDDPKNTERQQNTPMFKKYTEIRKHIISNEELFNNDYDELFKHLFDYLYNINISEEKKRDCLITVSRYFYQNSQCIDQEINFYSCMLELRV